MHENPSAPAARPAETIRTMAVPQVAPPYDDELEQGNDSPHVAAGWPLPGSHGAGPGPAGGASDSAGPLPARGADPGEHHPGSHARGSRQHRDGGPGSRPPAGAWPGQFAQILAETLAGSRPAHQLMPWTTAEARRRIRQLGQTLATGQRPRVRRVMTSAPASGVLELTAVVGFGSRVRVLAVRLERQRSGQDQWRCTAIESA